MKLRILVPALAAALLLTACGRPAPPTGESPIPETAVPTLASTAAPKPSPGEPPILDWLNDQPAPEFLDEEQQDLFLRAYSAASFLMGCSTSAVDAFPNWDGSELTDEVRNSYELVQVPGALDEGWRYAVAVGRYARWDDFKAMMDGLFTAEYQEKELLNSTNGATVYPVFTSTQDGRLCYLEMDRGSDIEYDWCDTPDSYELVRKTEDEIVFQLVGHYANFETAEFDEDGMPHPTEEYTRSYPIRMELTDAGWRFSQFHLPY